MKIIDLSTEHEALYCMCLEDWSDDMRESGPHKRRWYEAMQNKGLRVKLALDDNDVIAGMVQYGPIEEAFVTGTGLYFVYCIWVHGHKQGRGNLQKKGMGKALIKAAEEDSQKLGAKGLAVWGISLPFFMRASWFKKQGFKPADKDGISILLWKPFTRDAVPPQWIKKRSLPETISGKVTVTAFKNGWCPARNIVYERAKRAAAEFEGKVIFKEIDTSAKQAMLTYGYADALFIDTDQVNAGPPPSYQKIRKQIAKRVKKLT